MCYGGANRKYFFDKAYFKKVLKEHRSLRHLDPASRNAIVHDWTLCEWNQYSDPYSFRSLILYGVLVVTDRATCHICGEVFNPEKNRYRPEDFDRGGTYEDAPSLNISHRKDNYEKCKYRNSSGQPISRKYRGRLSHYYMANFQQITTTSHLCDSCIKGVNRYQKKHNFNSKDWTIDHGYRELAKLGYLVEHIKKIASKTKKDNKNEQKKTNNGNGIT